MTRREVLELFVNAQMGHLSDSDKAMLRATASVEDKFYVLLNMLAGRLERKAERWESQVISPIEGKVIAMLLRTYSFSEINNI